MIAESAGDRAIVVGPALRLVDLDRLIRARRDLERLAEVQMLRPVDVSPLITISLPLFCHVPTVVNARGSARRRPDATRRDSPADASDANEAAARQQESGAPIL